MLLLFPFCLFFSFALPLFPFPLLLPLLLLSPFASQEGPEKPAGHLHVPDLLHVPPLVHGGIHTFPDFAFDLLVDFLQFGPENPLAHWHLPGATQRPPFLQPP